MTLYESLDEVHNEPDGFSNYQQYIEKVYNRIMNRWNKTDYAKFSEIHCEAGMLVPNDK